jgi:endoribonuclease LACTB2
VNIVNVGYDSTNYYVLADRRPRLLVDAGWPGTLSKLQHQCKRMNIRLEDIPYVMVTHFHPDHAGLVQEIKRLGSKFILVEHQMPFAPMMENYLKPEQHYTNLDLTDNVVITIQESRTFLAQLGIAGEIITTPGHSDDSVTLVLDQGVAFIGDFALPVTEDETLLDILYQEWEHICRLGVKTIYPGHGPAWNLDERYHSRS